MKQLECASVPPLFEVRAANLPRCAPSNGAGVVLVAALMVVPLNGVHPAGGVPVSASNEPLAMSAAGGGSTTAAAVVKLHECAAPSAFPAVSVALAAIC